MPTEPSPEFTTLAGDSPHCSPIKRALGKPTTTGGPPAEVLMVDEETLRAELAGLEFLHLQECEREIQEGAFHNGLGAVVQMVVRKP